MAHRKFTSKKQFVEAIAVLLALGAGACGATGQSAQGPSSSRQPDEPALLYPNGPANAGNSRSPGAAETMPLGDAWDASSSTPSTVDILGAPVPSRGDSGSPPVP